MDTNVVYGGTATFTVAAVGTAISYQWYKAGLLPILDQALTGQTRTNLVFTNVGDPDAGQYYVKVNNASGTVASSQAVLTLVTNSLPVANNDSYSTLEDVPLVIPAAGVFTNDTDVNGQALTALLLTNVSQGRLIFSTNGSFTYTPNTNYNGSDSFVYCVSDGHPVLLEQNNSGGSGMQLNDGETGAQSFRHGSVGGASYWINKIVVYFSRENKNHSGFVNFSVGTGINSGAIAGSALAIPQSSITNATDGASFQTYTIVYGVPFGPFVAGTSYYLNFDNQTGKRVEVEHFSNISSYANGTFYFNGSNQNEDMRFQIYETILSNPATVTINVTPVNDPPVAVNDSTNTLEDTSVTIPVLANDSDPENTPLSLFSASATNGTVVVSGTNVVFTPATNFNGSAVFNYTVTDGSLYATGTVTVAVMPVNDPPVTYNDVFTILEDMPLVIPAGGVLTNDVDVEGDVLTALLVSNVTKGTLNLNANGGFIYTSNTNYNGSDSFTYRAKDASSMGNVATVTINITPVNDAPVAVNDSYTTLEDTTLTVLAGGVLANDTDVEGDPLTVQLVGNVSNGTLNLNVDGGFTYAPNTNYNGVDSFTYRANDGLTTGIVATATLNITPVYDLPVTADDSTNTWEDTSVTIKVLANDYNPDRRALTITSTSATNGTAVISGTNVVFTPSTNFNGTALFTYTVFDGSNSVTGNATVTVAPVNDAPVAGNDSYTILEDSPLVVPATGVLTNDLDVEGDPLTVQLVGNVTKGTLNLNANGGFTYAPNTNYNGVDSFTYRPNDGTTNGNLATVTINITPIYDLPVAVSDSTNTLEDTSVTIKVLANDFNPDSRVLTITSTAITNGTATISGTNIVFLPATNFNGTATFTYTVFDGSNSVVGNVTVTVTPVNDVPVPANDAYTTLEDTQLTVAAPGVIVNDLDVDGDPLKVWIWTDVSHGSLTLNTNGGFTYQPDTNYNGTDSFSYYESDGQAFGNTVGNVTINITPVNDAPVALNDLANTLENTSVTIKVLANDSDVEGTPLIINGTSTTNGTAIVNGTNVVFTPSTNFYGTVVFSYTVSDGTDSTTASVTVNVAAVNYPPDAGNDSYTTPEDDQLTVPVAGVLANDTVLGGGALVVRLLNNVTNGTLNLNTNGSFTYLPSTNYNGGDRFTYRAEIPAASLPQNTSGGSKIEIIKGTGGAQSFRQGASGEADYTISKIVLYVSREPALPAVNPFFSIGTGINSGAIVGSSVTIPAASITNMTSGASFQPYEITYPSPVGPFAAGTTYYLNLTNPPDKRFFVEYANANTYTNGNYYANGSNQNKDIRFQVFDSLLSGVATVTLTITPVNDAPLASNDAYVTLEDVPLVVPAASGVLTNDMDADGDVLAALLVSNVAHGSLNLNPNGSFIYIPATNYNGSDSFTYRANDGVTNGNVATVTIYITPVTDAPIANNGAYITSENVLLTVPPSGILTNVINVENASLSASLVASVSHGILNLNTNGSFTYKPNSNYFGSDFFTYCASVLSTTSAVATVTLTVRDTQTPLSFVSTEMTASGFTLHLSEPGGYECVVEASTNLVDWIPIFTNAGPSGVVVLTDDMATNIPSRFYRAMAR